MTIEEVLQRFGGVADYWRSMPHGSWAHKNAEILPTAKILGPCVFLGGEFRGGVFRGGEFRGGEFWGGEFWGGVFRGGEFWGGEFRGGAFLGGVFSETPLQVAGLLPWIANVCGPKSVAVGCEHHTLVWWRKHAKEVAAEYGVEATDVKRAIELFAAWFRAHPKAVVPERTKEAKP